MKLYYQTEGSGHVLVILHGLFGSSDNWRGVAKQLSKYARVISVDLRNHGRSPHSSQQDYSLMVEDLIELLDELGLDSVDLIGHSVGGKVAMAFAETYPDRLNKLIVVDISPRQYKDEHSEIFKAIMDLDLPQYSKRSEADKMLSKQLPDKSVRQFLLMNLAVDDGKLAWKINLPALCENYVNFLAAVCEQQIITTPTCFIRGSRSRYILQDDERLIMKTFSSTEIHTIENAGHWIHAEAPQQFLNKVKAFLDYD